MQVSFFAFLLSVLAFEMEVRLGPTPPVPLWILGIHLCFALPALGLWALQLVRGKQAFVDPPAHKRRGRILLVLLSVTVATGFWSTPRRSPSDRERATYASLYVRVPLDRSPDPIRTCGRGMRNGTPHS